MTTLGSCFSAPRLKNVGSCLSTLCFQTLFCRTSFARVQSTGPKSAFMPPRSMDALVKANVRNTSIYMAILLSAGSLPLICISWPFKGNDHTALGGLSPTSAPMPCSIPTCLHDRFCWCNLGQGWSVRSDTQRSRSLHTGRAQVRFINFLGLYSPSMIDFVAARSSFRDSGEHGHVFILCLECTCSGLTLFCRSATPADRRGSPYVAKRSSLQVGRFEQRFRPRDRHITQHCRL